MEDNNMREQTRFWYLKAALVFLIVASLLYVGQPLSADASPWALLKAIEAEFLINEIATPLAAPDLQVAHLAPFAADLNDTAVDISINGTPVLANVLFGDSTGYVPVSTGVNQIQVFPSGSATPAISVTVILTDDMDFTAVAVGGANGWPLELLLLEDDNSAPASGNAKVRIGHLAPFAADLNDTLADVRLQDGTVVLNDVPYGAVAGYLELPAGDYDLKITTPDGATTLIDPLPVTFNAGDILSAFAVGDGGNQPVGAFALPSGAPGALLDLAAALQIAHLAPFAQDGTLLIGTSVTIALNGEDILEGVKFAGSTGYLPVPAGWNQVQIFPTGSATPAISATVYLTHALDFTALAVGGANGWPLELLLLEDDNSAPTSGNAKVRIGHLAPFAALAADTLADVRLQDGTVILNDVPYGAIAGYLELPEGTYDLKITSPDGTVTLIDPRPVELEDGDILSIFAVGDGSNQALGIFALPSGAPGMLVPLMRFTIYMPLVLRSSAQ
jgi:nitrogen fixation protein